jgi:hypothetical protein
MTFQVPLNPREERRARNVRWATTILSGLLVALLAYMVYAGFEGSDQLVHPDPSRACRLPSSLDMPYQAINYDQTSDSILALEPDPDDCAVRGEAAGTALVTEDGIRLAGWYIPAAAPIGTGGPTVVMVHGHSSNKSALLPVAQILHPEYNLVLFDLRNHGQSFGTETTGGLRERADIKAVVAWLRATYAPSWIGLWGGSMGGIAATGAVSDLLPVQALVLDSTPGTVLDATEHRIAGMGYPLSLPASWAVVLGTLFRTGADVTAADPMLAIDDLGPVPVLILQGSADTQMAADTASQLAAEATAAGVQAEVQICEGAGHSQLHVVCADAYPGWVLGFLARSQGR